MKTLPSVRITDSQLSELEKVKSRQAIVESQFKKLPNLFALHNLPETAGQKNCENWIGSVVLPIGVVGPVEIIYKNSPRGHYVPIATTEGALVASLNRGAKALSMAGGSKILVKKSGMSRAPVFACESGEEALLLQNFIDINLSKIKQIAEATSKHLQFINHQTWVRGKHLYVRFVFDTSEAMGMNMVTIATGKICDWLEEQVQGISLVALSSNVCSDKKDNLVNTLYGRGYWAQAEAFLSEDVLDSVLKTTTKQIVTAHVQKNLIGSNIAGSFSQNAQVANVLAGIFLATGQDPAHIIEGSRAFLTVAEEMGGVYVSLTLPNLNMGTVGGGTYLPSQREARELIGMGELKTDELIAVTAASCLAGELSLLASLTEKSLARAHQTLAR